MKKQIHAYFLGRVQGVGFRFICEELAKELEVYGWVKNLKDGRVEITAEADEPVLQGFIERLKCHFQRNIQNIEEEWSPATGEFRSFEVEF